MTSRSIRSRCVRIRWRSRAGFGVLEADPAFGGTSLQVRLHEPQPTRASRGHRDMKRYSRRSSLQARCRWAALVAASPARHHAEGRGPQESHMRVLRQLGEASRSERLRDEGEMSRTMTQVKAKHGVPGRLQSCHTAVVNCYVLEGTSRRGGAAVDQGASAVVGVAVPGMPSAHHGMSRGTTCSGTNVLTFGQAGTRTSVFASYGR